MKLPTPDLKIYTEPEMSIYVAPQCGVVAISVGLQGPERGAFSEPFLLYEQDINGRTWPEYYGEEMRLILGRYIQSPELELIKKEVRNFLLNNRKLSEKELTSQIEDVVTQIGVEFDTPSEPCEVLANDTFSENDFLPSALNDELGMYAILAAGLTIPYMHPWDAYTWLVDLREVVKEDEQSEVDP